MSTNDRFDLPPNLPVPVDDGACDHLVGMEVPRAGLPSTGNLQVCLHDISAKRIVLYGYPRTGTPGVPVPKDWDLIPGARGCTPETCAFRDQHTQLRSLGAETFGLSTQTTAYQQELVQRLQLPFEILSDADLRFTAALRLPTFEFNRMTLIKRLTLIIEQGRITKVFYPIFPPDKHAAEVVRWLSITPPSS
ncbi:MAG: peroxiredoxin [Verrucomicrobiota bacterium]